MANKDSTIILWTDKKGRNRSKEIKQSRWDRFSFLYLMLIGYFLLDSG